LVVVDLAETEHFAKAGSRCRRREGACCGKFGDRIEDAKLACSICSVVVKNRAEVSEVRICEIIEEIDTFLARNMSRYAATEIAA
jgi:hypothetical protein